MQNIGLIIPCYNEEKRLPKEAFDTFLSSNEAKNITFFFIDDGSTDNTKTILQKLADLNPNNVKTLFFLQNNGKAEAVRKGVLHANNENQFEYIGFLDADLSCPLNQLKLFITYIESAQNEKIIFGSRILKFGSKIKRNSKRHYLGRVFSTVANSVVKIPVYDSQCGAKFFHKSYIKTLFNQPFKSKWIFDLELILRVRNQVGIEKCNEIFYELPLNEWNEIGGSKIKFTDFLKIPNELIKINRHYN